MDGNEPADVTVYSNAEKVRLYIDGKLIGEQFPDDVRVSHRPLPFGMSSGNIRGATALFCGQRLW